MVSGNSKTVLLASVGPAALLALVLLAQWRSTSCAFREQPPGSGLYTCTQRGGNLAALVRVSSPQGWLWTKRQVDHWVLLDAGSARDSWLWGRYASGLLGGVRRALRPTSRGQQPGQLDFIILTSSRAAAALPKLLKAYPDVMVAAHADEAPYLLGDPRQPPTNLTKETLAARVGGVPQDRFLPLPGEDGDVSDFALAAGGRAKKALHWLPRGTLRYIRAGNPHNGSIAVVHSPSGAMLAGEALAPTKGWLGGWKGLAVQPEATAKQRAATKRTVAAEGYDWLLPAAGGNFSRQTAADQAELWPERSLKEQKEEKQQERERKKREKRRAREEEKEAKRKRKEEQRRAREEEKEEKRRAREEKKEEKKKKREQAKEGHVEDGNMAGEGAGAAGQGGGGIWEVAKRAAEAVGVADTAAAGVGLSLGKPEPGRGVEDGQAASGVAGGKAAEL